jgi:GntR family transcriptional repressor for pyruvate dehydrogenase complex
VRRNRSLVGEVTTRIRELIEDEKLSAGDRLPTEMEFLERHRVSRSVLREAINRLETIGLVEVRQGQGMFVGSRDSLANCLHFVRSAMTITPHDLTQFGELRGTLEVWAARRAAERATPDQIANLEALVSQLDQTDRSYDEAIALDFQFHRTLFEIAGNALISNVIVVLQEFVVEGMLQTTPEPRDHHVSQQLHRAIVQALRDGDPDAAERAMKTHMEVTCERLAAHAARQNQLEQAS